MKKTLLKKITYLTVSLFFLNSMLFISGCNKTEEKISKTDFYIQTKDLKDFSKKFIIKKTGKLVGEQEITVSSQINGQVNQILLSNGETITKNQNLMNLKDTIANYNLKTQQARVALESAKIQHQQTKTLLQKSIDDAKLALENAKNGLQTTIDISEQKLKKAEQDYQNSSLSGQSISSLNIDNTVADINTNIENLKKQFLIQKTNIYNFLDDVAYFSDNLFGVTNKYKTLNDSFEIYLSAKNTSIKNKIENQIYMLYTTKSLLEKVKTEGISNQYLTEELEKINGYFQNVEKLLQDIHLALSSSVNSTSFPQKMIDGYISKVNGLQTQHQQLYASFVGYKNGAYTLLQTGTVKNTLTDQKIELLKKQAKNQNENAKIAFDSIKIDTKNSIFNAKQQVKNIELAYETAKKNYKNQLDLLKNQIDNAEINYKQSLTQSSKLYIKSPINGVISQVLVDQGQDIGPGTPLFKLSSNNDPIVEVGITKQEYQKMKKVDNIFVQVDEKMITGHLLSLSKTANKNGLYTAKVFLEKSVPLLGEIVEVYFYIKSSKYLIPLNIIQPSSENQAVIYILDKSSNNKTGQNLKVQPAFIKVGNVWGDEIELDSKLDLGTLIITSDIKNYDSKLNTLKFESEKEKKTKNKTKIDNK